VLLGAVQRLLRKKIMNVKTGLCIVAAVVILLKRKIEKVKPNNFSKD
jgi:hypothetical protein